jgi:hypothetical protein
MVNARGLELLHKIGANPAKNNGLMRYTHQNLPQIRAVSVLF